MSGRSQEGFKKQFCGTLIPHVDVVVAGNIQLELAKPKSVAGRVQLQLFQAKSVGLLSTG